MTSKVAEHSESERLPRWYFGGLAAVGATCFTHPLDLLKVLLQTQHTGKLNLRQMLVATVRKHGFFALYNGISASFLRQILYSTTRFAIYDEAKEWLTERSGEPSFEVKLGLAAVGGLIGGLMGNPADVVNVRMQNDVKLPIEKRRNYKHGLYGVYKIYHDEGFMTLYNGVGFALGRAVLMTVGQIAIYDEVKFLMVHSGYFEDHLGTHLTASIIAGSVATALTQPIDVVKTRAMNAKLGEFKSTFDIVKYTAKLGPMAFTKGFIPAFVRLGPQTTITFLLYEELIKFTGKYPVPP